MSCLRPPRNPYERRLTYQTFPLHYRPRMCLAVTQGSKAQNQSASTASAMETTVHRRKQIKCGVSVMSGTDRMSLARTLPKVQKTKEHVRNPVSESDDYRDSEVQKRRMLSALLCTISYLMAFLCRLLTPEELHGRTGLLSIIKCGMGMVLHTWNSLITHGKHSL